MSDRAQRVVILYANSLLGEGLGRMLAAADRALTVELVHVDDAATAECALAGSPDVVILERGLPRQALDLLRLAPSALFIDVGLDAGPTWTYRREEPRRTRGPPPRHPSAVGPCGPRGRRRSQGRSEAAERRRGPLLIQRIDSTAG